MHHAPWRSATKANDGSEPLALSPEQTDTAHPCPVCAIPLTGDLYADWSVCAACGAHLRQPARKTIGQLVDPGSFRDADRRLVSRDPLAFVDDISYRDRLAELRIRTGEPDAIITGRAKIGGHDVILAVLDFNFLGGTMGVVVGEKIARAAEQAIRSRVPLITIVASGGARMQEGLLSLMQMAKTAAAIKRTRSRGVPYISVLTNPTTGGVFASFANLGDVLLAEPGALIGFAGPRVAEQAMGHKLPPGTHTAEFLLEHGMIDAIVPRNELRHQLNLILNIVTVPRSRFNRIGAEQRLSTPSPQQSAWEVVQSARATDRPTSMDYIERLVQPFFELHGDRAQGDDPAVVTGIGLFKDRPIAIAALERGRGEQEAFRRGGRARPEGYRKVRRLMDLAARLQLPMVSFVDTPGAYPGVESEEHGLAAELASCMALMSDLPTPTVAAVIGEGGSGGALALAVADRVLMQRGAIYSVIGPEGAATILFRTSERAPELSESLRITASQLLELGLIDAIVAEPEAGLTSDPDAGAQLLGDAIQRALADLTRYDGRKLIALRWDRYQKIGRKHAGAVSRWSKPRSRSRPVRIVAVAETAKPLRARGGRRFRWPGQRMEESPAES